MNPVNLLFLRRVRRRCWGGAWKGWARSLRNCVTGVASGSLKYQAIPVQVVGCSWWSTQNNEFQGRIR